MAKNLTVSVADVVSAKIQDLMEKRGLSNKSELVEELIRCGIPVYEQNPINGDAS